MMAALDELTERCTVSASLWEQTPDGLDAIVVRKHKGKRGGK